MIYKKKITLVIIFLLFLSKISYSQENKILFKINNEIITTQDISEQISYLIVLNSDFEKLNKKERFEISKNSLIRQKVKKIEILKRFEKIEIKDEYIEQTLKSIYLKLGFKSLKEFNTYLNKKEINLQDIKKKLIIEAMWNQLIFLKFSSKVKINEADLKKKIKNQDLEKKSYLLSEIVFVVEKSSELNKKFELIKKTIEANGFKNAALTHSVSESAKIGGKLGWVDESSINKRLNKEISNLKINDYTQPIIIPSGFLIIKVDNIKKQKVVIKNIDKELAKVIKNKKNDQLNQFSNIYFGKIRKNVIINEL